MGLPKLNLSKETFEAICNLREQGYLFEAISKELGLGLNVIASAVAKLRYYGRCGGTRVLSDKQIEIALDMIYNRIPYQDIARYLKVPLSAFSYFMIIFHTMNDMTIERQPKEIKRIPKKRCEVSEVVTTEVIDLGGVEPTEFTPEYLLFNFGRYEVLSKRLKIKPDKTKYLVTFIGNKGVVLSDI